MKRFVIVRAHNYHICEAAEALHQSLRDETDATVQKERE
jgi:hypothetical protein